MSLIRFSIVPAKFFPMRIFRNIDRFRTAPDDILVGPELKVHDFEDIHLHVHLLPSSL